VTVQALSLRFAQAAYVRQALIFPPALPSPIWATRQRRVSSGVLTVSTADQRPSRQHRKRRWAARCALVLQRLDVHLAEFHYAPVVRDALVVFQPQTMLKRNSTVGKFTVLRAVNCFLPIKRHGKC
jgi:hypothetical protein